MCGIVGARHDWLTSRGLDPATAIARATEALAWRGPDGCATRRAGPWLLGCARLAISGPDCYQPVARRGERFVGVLNGAITNARELLSNRRAGFAERTTLPNDAWLPVLAVASGETAALRELRGHHAYAVADAKTGELVLGQDTYAEKPLHCLVARVHDSWQLVAFASTAGALEQLGMPTKPRSSRRLAEWFRYGWSSDRVHRFSTRLKLQSLPERGRPFTIPVDAWPEQPGPGRPDPNDEPRPARAPKSPAPAPAPPVPAPPVPAPPVPAPRSPNQLRKHLTASVARCLDSPSPAGLSLSGGIDSSCLAFALRDLDAAIPAYQFAAGGAPLAERNAAEDTAARAGLRLRFVNADATLLQELPRLTAMAGQPLGDPSILAAHAVAGAAHRDGVRILLGGEGADELLLGYARYRAADRLAKLGRLGKLAPRWLSSRGLAPRWSMHKAARLYRAAAAANPIRALLAVTPPAFAKAVLAPELGRRRCWRDAEPVANARGLAPALAARDDDLANYLPRDLLPKIDIALLAAGVEGRCPYLDPDVASFGRDEAALGKRPLREAFAKDLPESVTELPKFGFALPLDQWFRTDASSLDLLAEQRSREREHLAPGGMARAIDRHRTGKSRIGHALYLLLAHEIFLRTHEKQP